MDRFYSIGRRIFKTSLVETPFGFIKMNSEFIEEVPENANCDIEERLTNLNGCRGDVYKKIILKDRVLQGQ